MKRERWNLQVYIWATRLTGLIVRVPTMFAGRSEIGGDPVLQRRNASHSDMAGGELSLAGRLRSGIFAGFSTWATWGQTQRPDIGGGLLSEPAAKVPPPIAALKIGYAHPGHSAWLAAVVSGQLATTRLSEGDRRDRRICEHGPDRCTRVAGTLDVTVRSGVALSPNLKLTVALENLFDAGLKTFASGAYSPGRNLVVSLTATTAE